MKAAHTPGPWVAVGRWVEHPSDKRADICNCDPASMRQNWRSDKEICANARLIAAAPDLLDAVQHLIREAGASPDRVLDNAGALILAKAAFKKATGETA